jgi:hypothetical protein
MNDDAINAYIMIHKDTANLAKRQISVIIQDVKTQRIDNI